ncbi:MAG: type III secretion system export apparatus subunit SctU [Chlamydiales bacterium]|nr:type III secretion system export apparatus subunit SctU [Chlamydiales bacterium]
MGDKTEKASPKKLRDARKKGQVAKSQDLPSAFTFMASLGVTVSMASGLFKQMATFLTGAFDMVQRPDLLSVLPEMYNQAMGLILAASLPILGVVVCVGVAINFLAVGPCFATEVFKFDIKKFNPIDNLKAKFKMKTLVELIKSILKITIAAYLIYGVLMDSIPVLIKTVSLPIAGSLLVFKYFMMKVVSKVGFFFLAVAMIDFAYQKYSFGKEMMMEKFEQKQEYKNSEGDPHIKGKRKEIAREIAYSEGPSGGVKRAKAVVTNPTHLAVALAYEREVDSAPYIVAMGNDELATRIVKLAEKFDIPILRNVPLAHSLWETGELYEYVPEDTYEAVAEILRWLASLDSGSPETYEEK